MSIQVVAAVLLTIFPLRGDSYTLGVENGSKFTVEDVKLVSEEIKFNRDLGNIPVEISHSYIGLKRVPKQVLVEWSREGKRFSEVVTISQEMRQRVVDRSILYVRILDDGKAATYVEIINPLDLTKRTYYPPEFAPKKNK